jgi:glycopeptide antibiotics resistance protein
MISKAKNAYLALGVTSMLVAGSAMAALPASVATTVTSIETDGKAIFDLIFPVVGVFLGLAIVIKLFKRFSNKV